MQYLLLIAILFLVVIIIVIQLRRSKEKREIMELKRQLDGILDDNGPEYLMQFTDSKELIALMEAMNRILDDRKQVILHYQRTEEASRKMLSNISHDIRTPLTVILGYLEMMQINGTQDNSVKDNSVKDNPMLNKVQSKAQQVMEMIQKFFTLSKLESGDTVLHRTEFDVCETLKEIIIDYYTLLTEQEFEVEVNIPDDKIMIIADQEALNRIVSNLINNAIRYGKDGKFIGIRTYIKEDYIYVEVTDHGKGIEKDMANAVFDRLFTLEDSRSRKLGGSGLGLAIARTLAQRMGGNLIMQSEPNICTTFCLSLPYQDVRLTKNERNS